MRYARNGDVRLAYRVWGESDPTLVWVPGAFSNVDLFDDPTTVYCLIGEQLRRATRLVVWDKRGTGLSDPATHIPTLDERMDDLRAVMDAAEVDRAALFGISEGGPMSILFAATHPERVSSLVLYGTAARLSQQLPDFPWGFTSAQIEAHLEEIDQNWGDGALTELFFGAAADLPGVREMWSREQRVSASPTMARLLWQSLQDIDVRDVLGAVHAPTLVIARPGDHIAPFAAAAAMANAMPNARLLALPPGEHAAIDIVELLTQPILEFVCHKPVASTTERVLATVLFTDIVGSTEQLSASGDAYWRQQLNVHDKVVDWLLEKYGGRRAKHTGDGIFALFDGPTKAARCALDMVPALAARGIHIRAGLHTGECERRGEEWSGMAVHVGARISALAGSDEVLTSRTVRDLSVGSGLRFESLGAQRLKGLPEDTEVLRVSV